MPGTLPTSSCKRARARAIHALPDASAATSLTPALRASKAWTSASIASAEVSSNSISRRHRRYASGNASAGKRDACDGTAAPAVACSHSALSSDTVRKRASSSESKQSRWCVPGGLSNTTGSLQTAGIPRAVLR